MGITFSLFKDYFIQPQEHGILLVLSLKSSGNSTIIKAIDHLNKNTGICRSNMLETIFSYEVKAFDLSMEETFIDFTSQKASDGQIKGIIFFVDINDQENIEESKNQLTNMLANDNLKRLPLLICANQTDLHENLTMPEVVSKLSLRELYSNEWYVQWLQGTDEANERGLFNGLFWLESKIAREEEGRSVVGDSYSHEYGIMD